MYSDKRIGGYADRRMLVYMQTLACMRGAESDKGRGGGVQGDTDRVGRRGGCHPPPISARFCPLLPEYEHKMPEYEQI